MGRKIVAVNSKSIKEEWFSNVQTDILSGLVVALALISAATGAMALLMKHLVDEYGVEYLFATTILTGIIQFALGYFNVGGLMRFVSKAVMTGFVNALGIIYMVAQFPELDTSVDKVTWISWVLTAGGLVIIYLLPRVTKAVPSPLICIIVLTIVTQILGLEVRTVGDLGQLPTALPTFALPQVALNFDLMKIILPISLSLVAVGLLESFMTAQILDELTDTPSDKNREARGQGIANIVTGCFGGMAGCAMIGQSVINVKSGGRTRLSTFLAGFVLLILCLVLGKWVALIPMPALVAVMIMVSIGTFNWASFKNLRTHPPTTNIVMLATVGCVLYTPKVVIDVSDSHFWDLTSVGALDKVVFKFRREGAEVEVLGMNEASKTIIGKLGEHDKEGATGEAGGH